MVDRIAKILALHGDTDSVDVRRSKAIGILATHEWRSPHGYLFRVDETGTHPLGKHRPGRGPRQHE